MVEAAGVRIRYRNRRCGITIPTQEDQEISVGITLIDVLFGCPMIKEFYFHFIIPNKLIPLPKNV